MRLEILMAVNIKIFFWYVMPCSMVCWYQCFGRTCCLILSTLKMGRHYVTSECWYLHIILHGLLHVPENCDLNVFVCHLRFSQLWPWRLLQCITVVPARGYIIIDHKTLLFNALMFLCILYHCFKQSCSLVCIWIFQMNSSSTDSLLDSYTISDNKFVRRL